MKKMIPYQLCREKIILLPGKNLPTPSDYQLVTASDVLTSIENTKKRANVIAEHKNIKNVSD